MVALLPLVLANNYFYEVAILVALNAIVCVGLNLLIGYAGQISLGHAGFFALGGYGSAILATHYGLPPWLSLPLACAGTALLALLIGRPTLRLKGHYAGDGDAGPGRHHLHRHHHRGPPHRRARRHVGAAAGAVRLDGGRRTHLVLDRRARCCWPRCGWPST